MTTLVRNQGRTRSRRSPVNRGTSGDALRFVALVVAAIVTFFPVYISFVGAFTKNGSIVRDGIFPRLEDLTLGNFTEAVTTIPLFQQYLVSVGVVTLQTTAQIFFGALAAYALVFPKWRWRNFTFAAIVVTLAVPGESIVIPNYEFVSSLGLRDTILGVVLPYLVVGYAIFLLRQAFSAVPFEVWEAARLDGASEMRILFQVVIPMCRPQVTNAIIWSALAAWNGFFWPLLITDTGAARTIQVGIAQLASSEVSNPAVIFAGAVLVVTPTMILVIFAQRFLVNGLASRVLR